MDKVCVQLESSALVSPSEARHPSAKESQTDSHGCSQRIKNAQMRRQSALLDRASRSLGKIPRFQYGRSSDQTWGKSPGFKRRPNPAPQSSGSPRARTAGSIMSSFEHTRPSQTTMDTTGLTIDNVRYERSEVLSLIRKRNQPTTRYVKPPAPGSLRGNKHHIPMSFLRDAAAKVDGRL